MKIPTSRLSGNALEWAALTALGHENIMLHDCGRLFSRKKDMGVFVPGHHRRVRLTTDWCLAGPIFTDAGITTGPHTTSPAIAFFGPAAAQPSGDQCRQVGTTPLVAGLRCLVARRLGDEVDVPAEFAL